MLEQQGIDAAFLSAADSPASTPTTDASEAVTHLVKLGVVDAAQGGKIAHAAGVDAALSAQKEFDAGGQGDDFGAAAKSTSAPPRAKLWKRSTPCRCTTPGAVRKRTLASVS